jgi:hypothetical protein
MLRVFPMIGVAAMVLTGPAIAGVNLEYGQEYEEAYLLACERENSSRACICGMEALEHKVGFTKFAEEVDRHRDRFFERSPLATLATDLINTCTAVGQVRQ